MANGIVNLGLLLVFLAAPFWEAKPPNQWDDRELQQILTDSPWAQVAESGGKTTAGPPVLVFIATAAPMQQAEQELERRINQRRTAKSGGPAELDPFTEEYRAWLEENRATQVVVALRIPNTAAFSDEREVRRMEQECSMQVGRKKIKMSGHFPPSANDPYLRMAFPRQVQLNDKSFALDLYLPGVNIPYRQVQFTLKDMVVHGKLEL